VNGACSQPGMVSLSSRARKHLPQLITIRHFTPIALRSPYIIDNSNVCYAHSSISDSSTSTHFSLSHSTLVPSLNMDLAIADSAKASRTKYCDDAGETSEDNAFESSSQGYLNERRNSFRGRLALEVYRGTVADEVSAGSTAI
jgi:hypothetical protein